MMDCVEECNNDSVSLPPMSSTSSGRIKVVKKKPVRIKKKKNVSFVDNSLLDCVEKCNDSVSLPPLSSTSSGGIKVVKKKPLRIKKKKNVSFVDNSLLVEKDKVEFTVDTTTLPEFQKLEFVVVPSNVEKEKVEFTVDTTKLPEFQKLDFVVVPSNVEKEKAEFTVDTTSLPEFQKLDFVVVPSDVEYVWVHEENEECAEYIYEDDIYEIPLAEALPEDSDSNEEEEEEIDLEELSHVLEDSDVEEEDNVDNFEWSTDFNTFRGKKEEFLETPGPKIEGTDPLELFLQIWDQPLITTIVEETNRYAWQEIAKASEVGILPSSRWNKWVETTSAEVYRLMSILIFMGICVRGRVDEYWRTGVLGMPKFRELMTLDRFWLLMRFLHFSNNEYSLPRDHPKRKLEKIANVVDHLNNKFSTIYTPRQEMSIDESLLLWKGHLSWVQSIRSKAARFGLKSYELCEAVSGYCVRFFFYTGKGVVSQEPVMGFTSATAKIVIKLMQGFLGKGYTIFMDNFYNSVKLCRFFKLHKTDVVGTLNRRRVDTPQAIKDLNDRRMGRGELVSRHCGDVTVLAWKDVKLVTAVSTYHTADMAPGQGVGQDRSKPELIHAYNSFMGGVDRKDQKLSMYLLERKRGIKWYVKVFRRLLNISILNAYVIHCANASQRQKLTHRMFRYRLAEELMRSYGLNAVPRTRSTVTGGRLDASLGHYPEHQEIGTTNRLAKQERYKRGRCARCAKKRIRNTSTVVCMQCHVFLCVGPCWREYHTLEFL